MKKTLLVIGACIFFISNVFAGPFGDIANNLNAIASSNATSSDVFEGNIPEGQDLYPIIYRYTHDEIVKADKVVDAKIVLKKANLIEDEYQIGSQVYFKFGIGLQCQDSVFTVKKDGDKYKVITTKFETYNVDKKGKQSGDPITANIKTMNANSKNVITGIDNTFNNTKDDEYKHWEDLAYSDIKIQCNLGEQAPNRLKAKKWYTAHSLEGKDVELNFTFIDIKETKKTGYAYEVAGLLVGNPEVLIYFYSNNDDFIDVKSETVVPIKGKVSSVKYSGEYEVDYKIKAIMIDE